MGYPDLVDQEVDADDFESISSLPLEVRRRMCAIFLVAIRFANSNSLPRRVTLPEVPFYFPAEVAIYIYMFISNEERDDIIAQFGSPLVSARAFMIIDRLLDMVSMHMIDVVKSIPDSYSQMARSVLRLTEEHLWARFEAPEETALLTVHDFYDARSIAMFVIRAAARVKPVLAFDAGNEEVATGAALVGVCAILGGATVERLPTAAVRDYAIEFVKAALTAPDNSGMYVDHYSKEEGRLHNMVRPQTLRGLLSALRVRQKIA